MSNRNSFQILLQLDINSNIKKSLEMRLSQFPYSGLRKIDEIYSCNSYLSLKSSFRFLSCMYVIFLSYFLSINFVSWYLKHESCSWIQSTYFLFISYKKLSPSFYSIIRLCLFASWGYSLKQRKNLSSYPSKIYRLKVVALQAVLCWQKYYLYLLQFHLDKLWAIVCVKKISCLYK